ncbi:ABC transporter permease [Bacillus sp. WLY-B-L8]|uniref:ABC transporter permease n=1 Tax=Bacillus multifaciens TaxID=3068506 RepID=UPI0027419CA5|nr:FtsX-like permease family protein [Bacillus sp. WLY-B-L8]MDP7978575.1 ABC transporter permease [Bacillus sp. WLY-B-L8]
MLLKSALRSLVRNRLRTFFTVLSIVVGVASFFSMSMLVELVPRSIHESSKILLGGDVAIQSYLNPVNRDTLISSIPKEGQKALTTSLLGQSMVKSDKKTTSLIIKGIEPKQYPLYGDKQFPNVRNLQKNEVLLSKSTGDRLQVKVGDKVEIPNRSTGEMSSYKIRGFVEGVQESYGDASIFGTAYLHLDQAQKLLHVPANTVNEALIGLNDNVNVSTFKSKMQEQLPQSSVIDIRDKELEKQKDLHMLLPFLQLFSVLALGIAAITTSNTMKVIIATRTHDIAVMKSVGMKTRSIVRYFLLEAFWLAILGTAGGIGIGLLASVWLTSYLSSVLSLPLTWGMSWSVIGTTIIVGFVVTFLASWIPVKSGMRVSPLQMLRDTENTSVNYSLPFRKNFQLFLLVCGILSVYVYKIAFTANANGSVFKWLLAFMLTTGIVLCVVAFVRLIGFIYALLFRMIGALKNRVPQSLFLALHNIAATNKRNGLLAVTLTIGVVSVVSSHVFADNLIESVQGQLEKEVMGNLLITSSVNDEEKVEKQIQSMKEIKAWKKGYQLDGRIQNINGEEAATKFSQKVKEDKFFSSTKISVEGIDTALTSKAYTISEGRDLTSADAGGKKAILLDSYKKLGVKTGDTVDIQIGNELVNCEIVGFFQSGIVKTVGIRIPTKTLATYGKPNRITYSLDSDPKQTNTILTELNNKLPNSAMAYSIAATAIDSLQYIIHMQSTFFSIVALFAFLTAVLTIGNQVVIRLLQQTRDVAIIKTVGMSSGNLMKSILLENTIISLSAGLVGAGVALAFSGVVLRFLFQMPMKIDVTWSVLGILLSVSTTAIVVWIAAKQSLSAKPIHLLQSK